MNALALDLGASGGKLLSGCFDGKKIKVREVHRFHNEPVESGGRLVWDLPGIRANLMAGLKKAAPENFSSFGVDSFCNDYGLLDADGNLISQVVMYRDRRTEGVLDWMDTILPARELFERTGCQRARFNTLVQLAAQVKTGDQSLLEHANSLLFVPDLLNFFLCGEKAAEYTMASVSQVYNRSEQGWDARILRAFAIAQEIFPGVVPASTRLGEARAEILDLSGAKRFSICAVGQHDTASAVGAVPSMEKHFAYISSGTWSLMGTETDEMITSDVAYQFNFANEGGLGGRNRFLKNIMGLWLVQECQRQFAAQGMALSFEAMDAAAEKALPLRSIIDPDDPIFFQPGNMVTRIQAQCRAWKQPVPETVGEITRCIKESLALTYRATLQKLEELTGFELPCIHIIGGGAKSSFLNQLAADAMKRPVLAGPFEAAAIGNLCAQFVAGGEMDGLDHARRVICSSFPTGEFLPQSSPAWDEAYGRFLAIRADCSCSEL